MRCKKKGEKNRKRMQVSTSKPALINPEASACPTVPDPPTMPIFFTVCALIFLLGYCYVRKEGLVQTTQFFPRLFFYSFRSVFFLGGTRGKHHKRLVRTLNFLKKHFMRPKRGNRFSWSGVSRPKCTSRTHTISQYCILSPLILLALITSQISLFFII
jgi:hypothetical protein